MSSSALMYSLLMSVLPEKGLTSPYNTTFASSIYIIPDRATFSFQTPATFHCSPFQSLHSFSDYFLWWEKVNYCSFRYVNGSAGFFISTTFFLDFIKIYRYFPRLWLSYLLPAVFSYNPFIHQFMETALIDKCCIYKQKDLKQKCIIN